VMGDSKPQFDYGKVTVIFVLGGPGAGKGTQCEKLVKEFGFAHLSAGDLLRAEQDRQGSKYGDLIRDNIKNGLIVPMEVTVKLLRNAIQSTLDENRQGDGWGDGRGRFLIDGFPRKMDQALYFEETVCVSKLILNFTCTEEVLIQRLLERGKTSGRADDNVETIRKRFITFHEQTMPVVEHYKTLHKVAEVDGTRSIDEVYQQSSTVAKAVFAGDISKVTTS